MANNCVKALPPCELRTHQYAPLVREGFSLFFIQISPSGNEQLVYKMLPSGFEQLERAYLSTTSFFRRRNYAPQSQTFTAGVLRPRLKVAARICDLAS